MLLRMSPRDSDAEVDSSKIRNWLDWKFGDRGEGVVKVEGPTLALIEK